MNQFCAIGRVTKAPELTYTTGGTAVCRIRLAVPGMGRAEQRQPQPGFINVSQYGPGAEAAAQWLKQGSQVAVSGRMQWREWTGQDDVRRETHEIVGDIQFLADLRTPEDHHDRDVSRDQEPETDAESGDTAASTPAPGARSELSAAAGSGTVAAGATEVAP